ncbi:MAG: 30S ribosomal protein S18 [Proteobacteria bacterium]|nr:30S ribosomal protein S18 [Pseudomonadota bacterium]
MYTEHRGNSEHRGSNRGEEKSQFFFRKKVCRYCKNAELRADYKDARTLRQFMSDRGKILPRRITGLCAKHQRSVAQEIKRARVMALLPFTTVTTEI